VSRLGNKFFSVAFTWLLEQRFHDTLCGAKVLFKRDDEKIAANRDYFGDFNPFGDGAQVTWRAGIATSHARIGAGWDRVR
jgi:hypothetical protein